MYAKYMERRPAVEEARKEPFCFLKGMFVKRLPLGKCCGG